MEKYKTGGAPLPAELKEAMERARADYDRWLDARYAAARGHADAIIDPLDTRKVLTLLLEAATANPGHTS